MQHCCIGPHKFCIVQIQEDESNTNEIFWQKKFVKSTCVCAKYISMAFNTILKQKDHLNLNFDYTIYVGSSKNTLYIVTSQQKGVSVKNVLISCRPRIHARMVAPLQHCIKNPTKKFPHAFVERQLMSAAVAACEILHLSLEKRPAELKSGRHTERLRTFFINYFGNVGGPSVRLSCAYLHCRTNRSCGDVGTGGA